MLSHFISIRLFVIPMDCSPPGSSVHGIFQTRILEWVAIPSSRGSSWLRDQTQVSCIYCWVTWEAPCESKQEAIIEASADGPCSIFPPWNCAPTEDQVISAHVMVILLLREFRAKGLWYFYRPWGGVGERYGEDFREEKYWDLLVSVGPCPQNKCLHDSELYLYLQLSNFPESHSSQVNMNYLKHFLFCAFYKGDREGQLFISLSCFFDDKITSFMKWR